MLKVYPVAKRDLKLRRSPTLQPKYRIGQLVELHIQFEGEEVICDRGIVQGFAYLSLGYECMCASGSGMQPNPGFSYCILIDGCVLTLANEREVFLVEEVLCESD